MKIDRIAWIGVLSTFAIAVLFAARDLYRLFAFFKVGWGWDLRMMCAGFAALSEGKDPYIVANIGGDLPFPYPILTAYPAKFLCPIQAAWPKARPEAASLNCSSIRARTASRPSSTPCASGSE